MVATKVGSTLSLNLSGEHKKPSEIVQSAKFVVGMGIKGDRHATDRKERQDYQVLLMDSETLQELDLEPGVIKEQVTTTGIDVPSLKVGQQIALGDEVVIKISKDMPPCSRMEEIRPGLQTELEGRRGMLASIVTGGTVNVGDPIRLI
jgi:MOSC domain-containing protein YiiM